MDAFLEQSFNIVDKYQFIFLSFIDVSLRIPEIRKQYVQINKKRQDEFKQVFRVYMAKGFFRKDLNEHILTLLVNNIFILNDFWHSYNTICLGMKGKKALTQYKQAFQSLFFPYLTPGGMQFFGLKKWY